MTTPNDATRNDVAALERDAEGVLLMVAELVARARAGLATAEANAAMLRASAALAKPFAEEGKRDERRRLLEVVDAVADAYRRLPAGAAPKTVETTLRAALQTLGFNPAASSLATLAVEHGNMKARGGPLETAKLAVAQVGPVLLVERRRRLGLGSSPSSQSVRNVNAPINNTALELLLTPHAAGTFNDALAALHSPTDTGAEGRWAAMQAWSGETEGG